MKREFKLSCEITQEANGILVTYCKKHERPKGFLIEKMIRTYCVEPDAVAKPVKAPKSPRKNKSYPDNLDEQFLLLWDTKGKRGSKPNAYEKYKAMSEGETEETLEAFTKILMDDIIKNKHVAGYADRMLTSYLNGKFWE